MKVMRNLALGLSLWNLTACGWYLGQGSDSITLTESNFRKEALFLASQRPETREGLDLYASCEALTADLNKTLESRWLQQRASISTDMMIRLGMLEDPSSRSGTVGSVMEDAGAPTSKAEASTTMTNVQEIGVDEADSFRVGNDQIFAISYQQLQVIDRASLRLQGSLDLSAWQNPKILTHKDRLIIIGRSTAVAPQNASIVAASASRLPGSGGGVSSPSVTEQVLVGIYSTAPGQLPVRLAEKLLSGALIDSRLLHDQLVLVLNDLIKTESADILLENFAGEPWYGKPKAEEIFYANFSHMKREARVKVDQGQVSGLPCQQIVARKVADWDFSLAKMLSFDVINFEKSPQSMGSIGQGDQLYMNTHSLYLLKTQIQWFDQSWNGPSWRGSADESIQIREIGFDGETGVFKPLAEGSVRGHIKDRWSLRALNNGKNLVITTSTGNLWSQGGPDLAQNHLFVLESAPDSKQLKVVGKVEDFGTHEDIRAVRYQGDTVYVVTFKKTDPLFAIDISIPSAPKILSGLKIPGFSTYLHPLASGRLLGIGFDALDMGSYALYQGIQVSLFDTSNPLSMSRLDQKVFGQRGSSSEVTWDPHAFFYDSASQLIGMPLVELSTPASYGQQSVSFSGAQLLTWNSDQLVSTARITHSEWIPASCKEQLGWGVWWQGGSASLDINRLYLVDQRLVSLSKFGLKAFALNDYTRPTTSFSFPVSDQVCKIGPVLEM